MKLNGSHKFKASSQQVYNAILNPAILKKCIPGCQSIEYLDTDRLKANITTPLPGLKGPYAATIDIAQRQEPSLLVLEVHRRGRGGSVDATSHIHITDEADGALLTYNANANLDGPIAVANNPLGERLTKNTLGTIFENLERAIA
jgi:carbon monoxide dehydrogenase subunit G